MFRLETKATLQLRSQAHKKTTTLYPSMRFISFCIAQLVSSTERRTLKATYKELSSGAIATRLRTTAGPPTYRKPLEADLGMNVRTPEKPPKRFRNNAHKKQVLHLLKPWFVYQNAPPRQHLWCELYHSGACQCFEGEKQVLSHLLMLSPSVITHNYWGFSHENNIPKSCSDRILLDPTSFAISLQSTSL